MRRSPPPLGSSSPRATPPPLSPSGLPTSCDKAGASTHAPPPAPGDTSTGQPLRRQNSETSFSDFEIALTKLENYAQAMKNNNIKIKDVRVKEKVAALLDKMYQQLPPELQEQVRAELNATFPQHAQEENGTRKKLVRWIKEEIVPVICLALLMVIIKLCSICRT